jgi:hypothetical protein
MDLSGRELQVSDDRQPGFFSLKDLLESMKFPG